jgi:hypothetical protein
MTRNTHLRHTTQRKHRRSPSISAIIQVCQPNIITSLTNIITTMTHRQNTLAINAIDSSPVLWVAEEDDGRDCEGLEVSIRMSNKAPES